MTEQEVRDDWNRIRGKMLGMIESWGLAPRHESGAKQTFKALSYDVERRQIEGLVDESVQAPASRPAPRAC